jgi:hypothetical protein
MLTTAEKIVSDDDFKVFVDCYDREYGANILSVDFLRLCDDVFLFRDGDGNPVGGYTINTKQAYRMLSFLPDDFAQYFRDKAKGLSTYELGTIWVDNSRRNGREKLELWLHIFGNMISRSDTVMVGATSSEDIYRFYSRYGMKLAYYGPFRLSNGTITDAWIIYTDDLASSKVPEMYEQLKRRLG